MPNRPKPSFPQLNMSHPLAQGIIFDATLFENAGSLTTDSVTATKGTVVASGAIWMNSLWGALLDFTASPSAITYVTRDQFNGLTRISWEGLFMYRTLGGNSAGRLFVKGNANTFFGLLVNAGILRVQASWTGTSALYDVPIPSANTWHHVIVSYDGSSPSNSPVVYIDGILQTMTVTGTATGSRQPDSADLTIGNRSDGLRAWDGQIAYERFWNRILSAQEVAQLYADPFQIYRKKTWNLASAVTAINHLLGLTGVGA